MGTALLPHARRMLAEWDAAWQAAERAKSQQRATLVVGMSTSPGRGGLLPAIRSRFTAAHPEARVSLRQVGWDDATAGLADGTADVAFVWLPVPDPGRYTWVVVAEEPRLVAMPQTHPLAGREIIDFAELLDEPFLALPDSAGPLRDYWLALDVRDGRPPRIGAEIASTDETYEALMDGRGICLLAAGNTPLIALEGVITRPVRGLSPSRLALAWRAATTARSSWTTHAPASRPSSASDEIVREGARRMLAKALDGERPGRRNRMSARGDWQPGGAVKNQPVPVDRRGAASI